MSHVSLQAIMISILFSATGALAQVANPADAAANSAAATVTPQPQDQRYRSWEYPVINVVEKRIQTIREEGLIGSYEQPLWTATRRFPTTRVYVVPEGKLETEYWLRTTVDKDGATSYRSLWELEFGLPNRFQLDLYYRTDQKENSGNILISEQIELRYALADWGVIPGNPTLYCEWIRHEDGPDQIEPKILFGGELAPRWHWGLNFVGEFEMGGDAEYEYAVKGGLSYSVIDYKLSLGAEGVASYIDTKADRGNFEKEYLLGPSLQYRPLNQMTINLAALLGVTPDSPQAQFWFNVGWEL